LKEYLNKIVPNGFKIYIEFKDNNHIDLWVYEKSDSLNKKLICLYQQWNINPYNYEIKPSTK